MILPAQIGRGPVYPPTWADFYALTGVDLDSLYLCNEDSGNMIDRVGKAHQQKLDNTAAWDSGASSVQTLAGDGWVEWDVYSAADFITVGLSVNDTADDLASIKFGLFMNAGNINPFESGVDKGLQGTYAVGDKLRVRRVGTTITYEKQTGGVGAWALMYTSLAAEAGVLRVDTTIWTAGAYFTCKLFVAGVETAVTWQNVSGVTTSKDLTAADTGATIVYNDKRNGHRGIRQMDANDKHHATVNNLETWSGLYGAIYTRGGSISQDMFVGSFSPGTAYAMHYNDSSTQVAWRLVVGATTVHISLGVPPAADDRQYLFLGRVNRTGALADAWFGRRGMAPLTGQASIAGLGRLTLNTFGPGNYNGGGERHLDYLFTALGAQVEALDLDRLAARLGFAH